MLASEMFEKINMMKKEKLEMFAMQSELDQQKHKEIERIKEIHRLVFLPFRNKLMPQLYEN